MKCESAGSVRSSQSLLLYLQMMAFTFFYSVVKTFFSTKFSVSLKTVKNCFSKNLNIYILEVLNVTIFSSQLPDCSGMLTCEFSRSVIGCRLLSASSSGENEI